ncbi:amidohydrolase family protein [Reinekea blandensis]|uniref:Amidohydrolase 3 domain-containing protein n=1 Tax=Reinekea blandensis MED297 TaxID=314283 RepID=A4BBG9_9GAMM|nr:amidohydrolase family protein [Reinekea blandensis]EAR10304.1 hypothetical protein MED297_00745 [Reinekea sp. MED297] [Reinekea blandensis MED297]
MIEQYQIPLLKDHHTHPSISAAFSGAIKLRNVPEKADALALIRNSKEEMTVVLGWNTSYYQFSDEELESFPPVVICNTSLHGFLINPSAKAMLSNKHPDVIANIDDEEWVEANIYTILKFLTNLRPLETARLKAFYDDELLPLGVWYAEDMLLPNRELIAQFNELGYRDRTRLWADEDVLTSLTEEDRQQIDGIKLFTDGALGARTAAVSIPFLSGETGLLNYSDEHLRDKMAQLRHYNLPFAIHAIGDRATAQVVNTTHSLRQEFPDFPPVRIEHCQFISRETATLAKSLDIALCPQPNFSSDSGVYTDRLPPELCRANNPFRMLIDEIGYVPGEDLLFGSDGMPHGAEYALQQSLFPLYDEQRLTMDEFIQGYCMPDMTHGSLNVTVNTQEKTVKVEVCPA